MNYKNQNSSYKQILSSISKQIDKDQTVSNVQ